LAFAQALLPHYSAIDAYYMTASTIDEAVRRIIAVGGSLSHIAGVDNFCWPHIGYHPETNPDGKFKAAQLVRSCRALKDMCLAYGIPLLSGKDSMYVDGNLPGRYGETHKVSALETLMFSTTGVVEDVTRCATMDVKVAKDRVFVLGATADELGASEYYEHLGYTGCNVPRVDPLRFYQLYEKLSEAVSRELVSSVHGVYRGGLGVHLALAAAAGNLGMRVRLEDVPLSVPLRADKILFSESAGRFVATVPPDKAGEFSTLFKDLDVAEVGAVTEHTDFVVENFGKQIISLPVQELKAAWKAPFQDL
jgi:phosphoribosylformylglycinamidine synthase